MTEIVYTCPLATVFARALKEAEEVLLDYETRGGTLIRIVLDDRIKLLGCFTMDVTGGDRQVWDPTAPCSPRTPLCLLLARVECGPFLVRVVACDRSAHVLFALWYLFDPPARSLSRRCALPLARLLSYHTRLTCSLSACAFPGVPDLFGIERVCRSRFVVVPVLAVRLSVFGAFVRSFVRASPSRRVAWRGAWSHRTRLVAVRRCALAALCGHVSFSRLVDFRRRVRR